MLAVHHYSKTPVYAYLNLLIYTLKDWENEDKYESVYLQSELSFNISKLDLHFYICVLCHC